MSMYIFSPNLNSVFLLDCMTTPNFNLQITWAVFFFKGSGMQQVTEKNLQSHWAWCTNLPVESAPEARPLARSSALMSCRSVYEGAKLGLLVPSECVVQLLSEVRGHLPRESKEGHVQQGMDNGVPGGRLKTKSMQFKSLYLVHLYCFSYFDIVQLS